MNKTFDFLKNKRQSQLRLEIFKALEENDELRTFLMLQRRWVHRYGTSSLPDFVCMERASEVNKLAIDSNSMINENLAKAQEFKLIRGKREFKNNLEPLLEVEGKLDKGLNKSTNFFGEIINFFEVNRKGLRDGNVKRPHSFQPEQVVLLEQIKTSKIKSSCPPSPSIKHLRKWLPLSGES